MSLNTKKEMIVEIKSWPEDNPDKKILLAWAEELVPGPEETKLEKLVEWVATMVKRHKDNFSWREWEPHIAMEIAHIKAGGEIGEHMPLLGSDGTRVAPRRKDTVVTHAVEKVRNKYFPDEPPTRAKK